MTQMTRIYADLIICVSLSGGCKMLLLEITDKIINSFNKVHKVPGNGFLEKFMKMP